jgi:hypothetical protein
LGGSGAAILTVWQASVTRFRKSSHLLNNTKNFDQISDNDEKLILLTWARPQRIQHIDRHYDFFGNFQGVKK